jgi:hypothetical protein
VIAALRAAVPDYDPARPPDEWVSIPQARLVKDIETRPQPVLAGFPEDDEPMAPWKPKRQDHLRGPPTVQLKESIRPRCQPLF